MICNGLDNCIENNAKTNSLPILHALYLVSRLTRLLSIRFQVKQFEDRSVSERTTHVDCYNSSRNRRQIAAILKNSLKKTNPLYFTNLKTCVLLYTYCPFVGIF